MDGTLSGSSRDTRESGGQHGIVSIVVVMGKTEFGWLEGLETGKNTLHLFNRGHTRRGALQTNTNVLTD
jgi:hypothetical protein